MTFWMKSYLPATSQNRCYSCHGSYCSFRLGGLLSRRTRDIGLSRRRLHCHVALRHFVSTAVHVVIPGRPMCNRFYPGEAVQSRCPASPDDIIVYEVMTGSIAPEVVEAIPGEA